MHYRELFIGVLSTLEAASHVLLKQIDSWQLTLKSFKESQYLFGHGLIVLAFSIEDVLKQSSPKTSLKVVSVDEQTFGEGRLVFTVLALRDGVKEGNEFNARA